MAVFCHTVVIQSSTLYGLTYQTLTTLMLTSPYIVFSTMIGATIVPPFFWSIVKVSWLGIWINSRPNDVELLLLLLLVLLCCRCRWLLGCWFVMFPECVWMLSVWTSPSVKNEQLNTQPKPCKRYSKAYWRLRNILTTNKVNYKSFPTFDILFSDFFHYGLDPF